MVFKSSQKKGFQKSTFECLNTVEFEPQSEAESEAQSAATQCDQIFCKAITK
jgi:hypothetical protein